MQRKGACLLLSACVDSSAVHGVKKSLSWSKIDIKLLLEVAIIPQWK